MADPALPRLSPADQAIINALAVVVLPVWGGHENRPMYLSILRADLDRATAGHRWLDPVLDTTRALVEAPDPRAAEVARIRAGDALADFFAWRLAELRARAQSAA
jgi:hypothetical protein